MTNDDDKPRRLREVAEQLAANIPDAPARGRDVSNEPRIPKGQSGGGQWTTGGYSQATRSRRSTKAYPLLSLSDGNAESRRLAHTHTPAPFLDDHGNPVLNGEGKPMQRPADVDMRFFVDKGSGF